jgi:hypothetical protein
VSIDRLLRANRMVLALPVIDGATEPLIVGPTGTTTPFSAPAASVINGWVNVLTTNAVGAQQGGNVSCAILDDMTLGLADSDTDDELTICSIGNVDSELTVFRDKNKADTGVFNLALQLFNAGRQRYVLLDRIGYSQTAAALAGQDVSLYEVRTGTPVDVKEDRGNLKMTQSFNATGLVNVNVTLV